MEDYQRNKQKQGVATAAGRGGGGQPSTPATSTKGASGSSLPRVEPLVLTTAVQQTVPSLLQAGEDVVPEP